jgi:hypothetical protein
MPKSGIGSASIALAAPVLSRKCAGEVPRCPRGRLRTLLPGTRRGRKAPRVPLPPSGVKCSVYIGRW